MLGNVIKNMISFIPPPAKGRSGTQRFAMMLQAYVCMSFVSSHNYGTFYARKLKFGMLPTQI